MAYPRVPRRLIPVVDIGCECSLYRVVLLYVAMHKNKNQKMSGSQILPRLDSPDLLTHVRWRQHVFILATKRYHLHVPVPKPTFLKCSAGNRQHCINEFYLKSTLTPSTPAQSRKYQTSPDYSKAGLSKPLSPKAAQVGPTSRKAIKIEEPSPRVAHFGGPTPMAVKSAISPSKAVLSGMRQRDSRFHRRFAIRRAPRDQSSSGTQA